MEDCSAGESVVVWVASRSYVKYDIAVARQNLATAHDCETGLQAICTTPRETEAKGKSEISICILHQRSKHIRFRAKAIPRRVEILILTMYNLARSIDGTTWLFLENWLYKRANNYHGCQNFLREEPWSGDKRNAKWRREKRFPLAASFSLSCHMGEWLCVAISSRRKKTSGTRVANNILVLIFFIFFC